MNRPVDFKIILKRELESRMTRNPRYSMRAFAKDLRVAPALMSDILNGKRGLSRVSATALAKRLGMTGEETDVFCDLVESRHARSKAARSNAQARLKDRAAKGTVLKFLSLDQEKFSLLSDWYHLALLELMKTPSYRNDPAWIAKRLGLSVHQVSVALERMVNLGVIRTEAGRYVPSSENIQTPDGVSSRALKIHHEQFIRKSIDALYTQNLEERDFRGLTVKCRKSDVPLVRERMRKFLVDLDQELSQNADGEEVYQLSTQFFRLTQNSEES